MNLLFLGNDVAGHAVAVLIPHTKSHFAASMYLCTLLQTACLLMHTGQLVRIQQGQAHILAILTIETSRTVHVYRQMHAAAAECG